ncbi:related to ribosomal protein [Cephalotrichum gorgonifer]|uniref:Large ribosomal subunit protein uL29m n=1 Tax=Cephalotrichum gorgonifer TaxID=2041049 RepID=A0AAE8N3X8_9PEZI|nr:related to ribosomal protein [Cephalotrichum gorgonifer]
MATSTASRACLGRLLRPQALPLPQAAWGQASIASAAPFSTTAAQWKRIKHSKTRDNNRHRGVSPLRRTGLREPVSVSDEPLPQPSTRLPKIKVDPNHGLYAFFAEDGKLVRSPKEDREYGRAWTVEELRRKSWDDLHNLWWVCCRERNRISTMDRERERLKLGFGAAESSNRDATVKRTMKAIKHVLTERFYLWEDAHDLASNDPEINLSGKGEAYTPMEDNGVFEQEEIEPTPTSDATPPKPAPA